MNRQTYWTILIPVVALTVLAIVFLPKSPGFAELILISLGVPRLHDLGRTGWWIAMPVGLEVVGVAAGAVLGGIDGILIAGGLVVFFMLAFMIVLGLLPGQPEVNAFGAPPPPGFATWRKSAAS